MKRLGGFLVVLAACGGKPQAVDIPPAGASPSATPTTPTAAWVTVPPGGRYLSANGAPFLVIGNQPGTGFLDLPDADIDAHFARMEQNGETVARIDLDYAYPPEGTAPARYVGLESKLGVYDPARVARIDKTFELAKKHGVRLLLVPYVTSPPMWETWSLNPYGVAQGGPAKDPNDFVVSAQARSAFGARLEWIAERWGGSETFFGWDLMNEADVLVPAGAKNGCPQLADWVVEMGQRVAAKERALYGREHVRHVSWSELVPSSECSFPLDSTALNTAATHPYDSYGTDLGTYPDVITKLVDPVRKVHGQLLSIVGKKITDRRPFFENEHHQNFHPMLSFYREADHHLAWAELASGASGTGLTWLLVPDKAPQPHMAFAERHGALADSRRARTEFLKNRVPSGFFSTDTTDESVTALLTSDPAVTLMSLRRGANTIGWLVANDDTCLRVKAVDEVRDLNAKGSPYNAFEGGIALLIWADLAKADGVTADPAHFSGLMTAIKASDYAGALAAEGPVFTYFEGLESQRGTLARGRACADLAPSVTVAMPAGRYAVDWVDDRTGALVRSDTVETGSAALTTPVFQNHLAVVVRPQ